MSMRLGKKVKSRRIYLPPEEEESQVECREKETQACLYRTSTARFDEEGRCLPYTHIGNLSPTRTHP